MTIIGINNTHDASCCLVSDGAIVADVQEERFTRIKHSADFPLNSLIYCLSAANIRDINSVDAISIASTKLSPEAEALFGLNSLRTYPSNRGSQMSIKPPLYFPALQIADTNKVKFVQHHLAHAASAYFTRSSQDPCLIFTLDGVGNSISTAVWKGEKGNISLLKAYGTEASVGWAYSAVTEALGWQHGDGEGTTMGFAPYGTYKDCIGVLDQYFPGIKGVNLVKKAELGRPYRWDQSGAVHWHLEESRDIAILCEKYGRANIAAEAQRKLEEVVLELVYGWLSLTGLRRAAFAGGIFLNVKLNQKIWSARRTLLIEQHIYPNPGDSGLAAGAALYEYYNKSDLRPRSLYTLSLGPKYSREEILSTLQQRNLSHFAQNDPSLSAAQLLSQGAVVGWYNGRMESGPRALGNRSILMAPTPLENKSIINSKVKFREQFRPFCPTILWEKRDEYLLDARDEYFMITSFDVNPEQLSSLAAVTHIDGTIRPQMVKKEINAVYWRLIFNFGQLTGIYAVMNTSMNIKGEPIVNTPREALKLFFDSGMDALFLEDILLLKDADRWKDIL